MDLYVCPKCDQGAILVADASDFDLPKEVTSIKVISGKQVLSLFVSKAAKDATCPHCGQFIKNAEIEPVKKKKTPPP